MTATPSQISSTLLSIQADLSNAAVRMDSAYLPLLGPSWNFWESFGEHQIQWASITSTFHSCSVLFFRVFWGFFSVFSLARSKYFIFLFLIPLFLSQQSLYLFFGENTKSTNYNWYNCHFRVPKFFQFPSKVQVIISLFAFFQFHSGICWNSKVHKSARPLYCVEYY